MRSGFIGDTLSIDETRPWGPWPFPHFVLGGRPPTVIYRQKSEEVRINQELQIVPETTPTSVQRMEIVMNTEWSGCTVTLSDGGRFRGPAYWPQTERIIVTNISGENSDTHRLNFYD